MITVELKNKYIDRSWSFSSCESHCCVMESEITCWLDGLHTCSETVTLPTFQTASSPRYKWQTIFQSLCQRDTDKHREQTLALPWHTHLIDFPIVYNRFPPGDVLLQHPELALPLLARLLLVRHLWKSKRAREQERFLGWDGFV